MALQGDFAEHRQALERRGVTVRLVRRPADLRGVVGVVLPGGESTTMLRLLRLEALDRPIADLARAGLPVLATCAGLILCARSVSGPEQPSLGLLDVDVQRNGYGRQVHSGTFPLRGSVLPPGTTGVFIRAPRIRRCGPGVEVLARRDEDPVLVRQGAVLGACFHPELEHNHPVTEMFVAQLRSPRAAAGAATGGR